MSETPQSELLDRARRMAAIESRNQAHGQTDIPAAPLDHVVRLNGLLEAWDKKTQDALRLNLSNAESDRALWHMLMRWKDQLPPLDGYFHKCFRQCDVTDTGHEDMVIHCLLSQSTRFWEVFENHRIDTRT